METIIGGLRQGGGRFWAGGLILDGHGVGVLNARVGVAGVCFGPPDGEIAAGGCLGRAGNLVAKLGDVVGGPALPLLPAAQLNVVQRQRQATRLAQVRPELVEAYQLALRRWMDEPVLMALGLPFVSEGYRSPAAQDELYTHGRSAPGPVVTSYKRGGETNHNVLPSQALDVAFLLADGTVPWLGLLLSKFARLVKAADARVHWGGDWPGFQDRPHFEV